MGGVSEGPQLGRPVPAGTGPAMVRNWLPIGLELAAIGAILALAVYLRFSQLATNPGWYSDAGTLADIARHRSQGEVQYQALLHSTLLVARFPVIPFIVAAFLPAGGDAMLTLRAVTAALGVISTAGVYLATRTIVGPRRAGLALLAAGLYAVYPPAVFYARVGFSYNLLTPLLLLAVAGLWGFLDRDWTFGLVLAGMAIGLGSVTDLMMISLIAPAGLIILVRNWRHLLWWVPICLAPIGLYALSVALRSPDTFSVDLRFILALMSAVPWWAQLSLIVLNIGTLILTEAWWVPALIGLVLLSPKRAGLYLQLMLLVPLVLLGRSAGLAGLRLYSIIPLFPLLAIGVASLLWTGVPWLLSLSREAIVEQLNRWPWFTRSMAGNWFRMRLGMLGSSAVMFLLVLGPLLISTIQLLGEVQEGFGRGNSWAYVAVGPARAAADYVNQRAAETDLVLASPAIAWALDGQAADFQQVLAYSGQAAIDYPADLPKSRFAYEVSLQRAAYVIVDPIWTEWGAVHLRAVDEMLEQLDSWPVVWQAGEVVVRANPDR